MGEKPSRQNNLLLVTAGKRLNRGVLGSCLNIQKFYVFVCNLICFRLGERFEEALKHLLRQNNIVAHGKVSYDTVHLTILWQIRDAILHSVKRLRDLYVLAAHLNFSASHSVCTKDSAHTLASSGTEQSGETVYLALVDMEIERLDTCVADKAFRLQHGNRVFPCVKCLNLALDIGEIVHLFTEHLGYQLYAGQIFNFVFAHKLTVSHNGNPVADLVHLL